MALPTLNLLLHLAGFLAATITVCVSVQHRVKWNFAGVANYSTNSPLMVVLGDVVTFDCVVPPNTNIIYQIDRIQYDQCDVEATGSVSERIGVCISAAGFSPSHFSINIQKTAVQIQTGAQYDPGKMYYFTSYSTGSDISATHDRTKGGQCNDGLKMAVSVAPEPDTNTHTVSLTSSALASSTPNAPRNESTSNNDDSGESNTLIIVGAAAGAVVLILLVVVCFSVIICIVKWNRKRRSGVGIEIQEKKAEMETAGRFISVKVDAGESGKKEIEMNGVRGMVKKKSSREESSPKMKNGIRDDKINATDDDKINTTDAKETEIEKKERERKERENKERERKERDNKEREKKERENKEREKKERENKEREKKDQKWEGGRGGIVAVQTSEKSKRVASKNTKNKTTDSNRGAPASVERNGVGVSGKSSSVKEGRQNRPPLASARGSSVTTHSHPLKPKTPAGTTRSSSSHLRPPPPPPNTHRLKLANLKTQSSPSKVEGTTRRPAPLPPI